MAIVQRNLYLPGQDLTNLAQNVDFNRFQDFKGNITVNFGTVPATVTVKVGTILEVNGNLYAIETADYVFSMDNATHNYLTFTDNPGVDFGSAAARGTYSAAKQGYYQAGNLIRTLPFYINQTLQIVSTALNEKSSNTTGMFQWDRVWGYCNPAFPIANPAIGSDVLPINTMIYDNIGNWNTVTHKFTATEEGWYDVTLNVQTTSKASAPGGFIQGQIRVNGATTYGIYGMLAKHVDAGVERTSQTCFNIPVHLEIGDTIDFYEAHLNMTSGTLSVLGKIMRVI